MQSRPNGVLGFFVGVSRSGKSTPIKEIVKDEKRVLVFDPKDEYQFLGFERFTDKKAFVERIKGEKGNCKACFVPTSGSKQDFQFWCACAFVFNMQARAVLVPEELSIYLNSSKATGDWGRLVSQSLAYGPIIFATAQRGQSIDNDLINNASFLYVTQHGTDEDKRYMVKKIGGDITQLPANPYEFIVWRAGKGILVREGKTTKAAGGAIKFRGIKHGSNRAVNLKLERDGTFKGVNYF